MTRRVVVGKRSNGDIGIFVSPPGIDAMNATDAQLTLNISSKISQLILLGFSVGNQTIALGLSRSPFVFVTSQNTISDVPGFNGLNGPIRPSPVGISGVSLNNPAATATINSNGASMSISAASKASYAVYNSPFT
jgi:hypothetical protein